MAISIFDLFKIGIGPSSSHTVGPMKAASRFVRALADASRIEGCRSVKVTLFGSLGATGKGHGTDMAVILGLEGNEPETVNVETMHGRVQSIIKNQSIKLQGRYQIPFNYDRDLQFSGQQVLSFHPNGIQFQAFDATESPLLERIYYSVGGGFIVEESGNAIDVESSDALAYPYQSAADLLRYCRDAQCRISDIVRANERSWRSDADIDLELDSIWESMLDCMHTGIQSEGELPGALKVRRRAARLHQNLLKQQEREFVDPLNPMDWVTLYALSVNEVNAMGGRVVTAPTNGAAGIVPAVLRYFMEFCAASDESRWRQFLLTAGGIGILYKINASISGAEVGCQGEVGSACSMAAGALAEVLGGSVEQVENAAEIAMEHNLGLTCDPISGLVQVPCIERNAMAAIKAISSARLALRGDGNHHVSLDQVIKTMRDTGRDMQAKYKETATGGLAVNVLEVPVSVVEC